MERSMKTLIATIGAVALVAAAPASADVPTDWHQPYGPTVDVSRGAAAALAYWGRAPDCPDGVEATLFEDPDPMVGARGADCHIWIDQSTLLNYINNGGLDLAAINTCTEVVHEYGHLLGYGHSDVPTPDDPLDIMNGHYLMSVPQCDDTQPAAPTVAPRPEAAPARKHHRKHRHRRHHKPRRIG
jgi:hypothetical protein